MRVREPGIGSVVVALVVLLSVLPATAGTITGKINYEGKIPKMKPLDMTADTACQRLYQTPPTNELLLLGEGNTIANIFVQIKSGLGDKEYPVPTEPVVLDQTRCIFIPRVTGVMVGQPFKILNSDGLLHNVHSLSERNMSFNLAMPASMTEIVKRFKMEEDMFRMKCDVHAWMRAYVTVLDHPFYDSTGPDGVFTISGLPAGTYEVEAWHERLGTKTAEVTIGADETKSIDFTMSPPTKKRR